MKKSGLPVIKGIGGGVCLGAIALLLWWSVGTGDRAEPRPAGGLAPIAGTDQAILEGARQEGRFVWYTSLPTDAAVAYLGAFKQRYPFLDTSEFYRSTSYRIYSRVNIETAAAKHIADAVEISLVPAAVDWNEKGWLMRYDSPAYADYPVELIEPGYWAPMRVYAIVLAYNRLTLGADEVPRRWWDLTNPKWKDLIGVEGADSGTQHLQYHTIKEAFGAEYWERIAANRPRAYNGAGALMNGLLSGEIKVALCALSYAVYRYREIEKAPIEGIWPAEGVPVNLAPLVILAGAPHPNAAKLFVDWAFSAEGQHEMSRLVGAYSARRDVPSPVGQPAWGSFNALLVKDWKLFASSLGEFRESWRAATR